MSYQCTQEASCHSTQRSWTDRDGLVDIVRGRRDRDAVLGEHGTDRLDAESLPVGVDVGHDHLSRRSSSA